MKLLIIFIIFNALNVVIQTVKSIATIKCGKGLAAVVNAIAYGLYTYIIVLTVCDLPLWEKVLIIALCNFVGVFIVKLIEEKLRKDKLWLIQATIPRHRTDMLHNNLNWFKISHNYVENVGEYTLFYCYAKNRSESSIIKNILDAENAKFFVSETKSL